MSEWRIARRRGECGACGGAFADGQRLYSSLELAQGEIQRRDDCESCFRARARSGERVWWCTSHRRGRRGLVLDLDALAGLFHALGTRPETEFAEIRYLVCLLLLRKRRLRLRRCERDGARELLVVSPPRRSDEQAVAVIELAPERQVELARSLERVIDGASAEELGVLRLLPEGVAGDASSAPRSL